MKILKPFYYDNFKCIGGECIDNCCVNNWKIDIDEKTYKKYKKLKGEWGKKINSNISRIRKKTNYFLVSNLSSIWCEKWESNPHGQRPKVFETFASTYSATLA